MDLEHLKTALIKEVDLIRDDIIDLSHFLQQNPETGYMEKMAAKRLCGYLSEKGFYLDTLNF